MGDTKKQRLLAELVRIRNANQAQNLAKRRRQGKALDTVLHSVRIIGIDPKKKCPAERQLQQGHTRK